MLECSTDVLQLPRDDPAARRLDRSARGGGYYRGASPRPAMTASPSDKQHELSTLPIGMFDSGMGGLTVLHECLVQLPAEHFAYVGDTARFPYGEKSRDELELYSRQITAFLETVPVKLIVVACYSATSAALPALQERFETPIIGVVMPGARAAVETSRYRKIGVLATEATVASGAYPRAIHSLDSGAEVIQQACPGLVDFIEAGDVASQELADAVRGFTEPLKAQAAGRGHHGLHALPADRAHAAALPGARRHAHQPRRRDRPRGGGHAPAAGPRARRATRMGSYRFYTTGDVERFRDDGRPVPADAAHARARAAARAARRARRAMSSRFLVRAAVYAALYAALTLAPGLNALAYGQVQFRVSEALMVLRLLRPGGGRGPHGRHGDRQPRQPHDAGRHRLRGAADAGGRGAHVRASGRGWSRWRRRCVVNAFGVAAMLARRARPALLGERALGGLGEAAVLFTAGPRAAPRGAPRAATCSD